MRLDLTRLRQARHQWSKKLFPCCKKIVLVNLMLWSLICVACGNDEDTDGSLVVSRFPIDADGLVWMKVKVFNESLRFLVHTSSTICVLDTSFRAKLGLPREDGLAGTASGVQSITVFATPTMQIGDNAISFQTSKPIGCCDLGPARSALGAEEAGMAGLLGMSFLQSKIVRLNFDDGVGEFRRQADSAFGCAERMALIRDMPSILVRLPSEGFKDFRIDSASSGQSLQIDRELFSGLLKKKKIILTSRQRVAEINGNVMTRAGVLDCLEFGPHRFHNVSVREGSGSAIQLPFLKRFQIEFDFPNRVMRFRPGQHINDSDRWNRSGLGVSRSKGLTNAALDDSSGAAAEAGINDGDRILRINGEIAENLSLSQIRDLLREPGGKIRITIEHAGKVTDITLNFPNDGAPFAAVSPHEIIESKPAFDE